MSNARLLYIILICCSLMASPVTHASVFGAVSKLFKGSDEAAQVAGKSDEAALVLKSTDDMPLATKEAAETSDAVPLVVKEEQLPVAETPLDDAPIANEIDAAEDSNIIGDIAQEATVQAAEMAASESQEEGETTEVAE
ncbi:hypothetical protein [Candidatus Albibeggiatoa sp. nov. BB20]|uniref:hypothetical protein n=1 Tax=Candidatus Albibeggiatoa sp. nov. BB20 TaxID=3162723 RepID=UPI0033654642